VKDSNTPGFTLAEVLIALALLGIIAAFSIPQVLQNVQSAQQNAILKETVSILSGIVDTGRRDGTLAPATFYNYFKTALNLVKSCPNNSQTEGCWTQAPLPYESDEPGFVLPNGVQIVGFNYIGGNSNGIVIDTNGPKPPNTFGVDQIRMLICYGPDYCVENGGMPVGQMLPYKSGAAGVANIRFYNEAMGTNIPLP
jgi:prepilin-type N-terminal cleavage/methylation domain-containing protein